MKIIDFDEDSMIFMKIYKNPSIDSCECFGRICDTENGLYAFLARRFVFVEIFCSPDVRKYQDSQNHVHTPLEKWIRCDHI